MNGVRVARLRAGMNQQTLADAIGMSITTYSRKERDPSLFSLGELQAIAESVGEDGQDELKRELADRFIFLDSDCK
ncbi:hypothetical protein AAY81_04085 [Denitrobacterium detoxificans]|uniref:DNA-binding transcriptional regulator, XRE-family HTH domain n=1 Tax=Denitrobacterium detoxificans TaxID=79604 RepID=A0A172RXQ7_9ACTN|nr:helix-turn-helix transcriptional regulator [Denitrobacterium detoxificans]ANE22435.1 hypothetical protein AAY81_04085 [Denitrobacterium detoxificans]SEO81387.1 DNA-binding transcriptional regulator, XRE-family HTH domain [Denitrobacterium detoxificans]SEP01436.1 DNA-binding transcriptional regulator, XRE-family HTH domain [Denitrobacterium detoxificans]